MITAARVKDGVMIISSWLTLKLSDEARSLGASAIHSPILDKLRFESGQVALPRAWNFTSTMEMCPPRHPIEPESAAKWNAVFAARAVTDKHCADAAMRTEPSPPFLFLMDAAQALLEGDVRRTIIYAAIAAESASRFALDELGAVARSKRATDSSLRYRQVQPSGEWKDSVLDLLRAGDTFLPLLDEVPLYLIGKSLELDAPTVYRDAHMLYKTRNKLVHMAVVPDDTKFLPLTIDGARAGLECAIEIFEWWGMSARRFLVERESFPD